MFKILLCAVVSILLVGCASVDKALYEVSEGVSSVDRVTGERSLNLTRRPDQIAKSNAEIENAIKQAKAENLPFNEDVDAKGYARLLKIFKRVHSVSHMKDEDWHLLLVPDESFNAFVNGGSYVVVHKGLLDEVKSDDEIAAVLGHELAHVAANHRYEMQSHLMVAHIKGSKSASRNTFQSAFTHENEEEADEVGILYAALAGYDPYAASRLWKRMHDNEGDFSRVVVNHPINSERYKRSKELAQIYKRYHFAGEVNPKPEEALLNNPVFGRGPEDMSAPAPGQGGGLLALLEVVAEGVGKHYEAKAEEARQSVRTIKAQRVEEQITLINNELLDSHTMRLTGRYNGYSSLNNLTMAVFINDEVSQKAIPHTINPGSEFNFEVNFQQSLNAQMLANSSFYFQVAHVD